MDVNISSNTNTISLAYTSKPDTNNPNNSVNNASPKDKIENMPEIQLTGNDAAYLLQMVTSKLSSAVIRKIPTSEYMQLLAIIDKIISGSVDNQA